MVTRTSAEKAQPWLESPVWDCFWIFSGLWLLVIVLIAHSVGYVPLLPNVLALGALVLLWGGHILAPVMVIWTNRAWRADMVKNKRQCILLPFALLLMSVIIGIQPIFGTISYPIYHLAVFGICHWLIECALASRMLHSLSLAAESRLPVPPQRILRPGFSMRVLVFTLLSVLMYCIFHSRTLHGIVGIGLPSGYSPDSLFAYKTGIFPWSFGALSGAYFGISFVHFAYDRYLFKHQTVDNASPRL